MNSLIKSILSATTDWLELDFLVRISNQRLVLPFYHTVSDQDLEHIKHLYPVTPVKRFKEDLDFFQKNFTPVSYSYLLRRIDDKSLKKKNFIFLSFDDGLREFHDVVAPILIQRGIPATCFINSGFVDNKDMFFRLKASLLIEKIANKEITAGQKSFIVELFLQNNLSYNHAKDLLKITDRNKELLDQIAPVLGVDFGEYLSVHQPYLTTPQIENLIKQGFSFGAHSVSHPYFPFLPEDLQVEQVLECLRFLQSKFKVSERLFSFPYTDYEIKQSFFNKIRQDIDLTFGTANLKLDEIPTNFQRIPMELWRSYSAERIVKTAYLFFIVKMIFNKHVIYRI
ncbi:hypothetical protein SDC9_83224 [bioreactor metagenome]|uniref:NodB homology domain-containing protein n=1 Tax=bioreactor metagenome TaxID=1076179 RepID=A0A644Z6W6_9ZZZZ|nr:polysaccharide deacetylase family protein [Paludibacter sp.]